MGISASPFARPDPDRYTLHLPEPPSLNVMLDLAKQRAATRRGSIPIVYDRAKEDYALECLVAVRTAGVSLPRVPWPRWRLVAVEFRLHNERDPLELLAGLKWPVDWLVSSGFVANDSPRQLRGIPDPVQRICRRNRGITLTIERVDV